MPTTCVLPMFGTHFSCFSEKPYVGPLYVNLVQGHFFLTRGRKAPPGRYRQGGGRQKTRGKGEEREGGVRTLNTPHTNHTPKGKNSPEGRGHWPILLPSSGAGPRRRFPAEPRIFKVVLPALGLLKNRARRSFEFFTCCHGKITCKMFSLGKSGNANGGQVGVWGPELGALLSGRKRREKRRKNRVRCGATRPPKTGKSVFLRGGLWRRWRLEKKWGRWFCNRWPGAERENRRRAVKAGEICPQGPLPTKGPNQAEVLGARCSKKQKTICQGGPHGLFLRLFSL